MVVIFSFLDDEPIENVITCLHFKVSKVIYFGYHDVVQRRKDSAAHFLKKYCGVQTVIFHELSKDNLQSVLKTMRAEIERELSCGSQLYFDITGGEHLILVAFGMLSKEYETPMHMYDIATDKLVELDEGARTSISADVQQQVVPLDLEKYIEMQGAAINWGLHKNIKEDGDALFIDDVSKIWTIAKKYIVYWNPFSAFLSCNMIPAANFQVDRDVHAVSNALSASVTKLKNISTLNRIVDELADQGILLDVQRNNGRYRFRYKNQNIKECLMEGGSILELHTYQIQKQLSDDCKVGVHLDWDGVIHNQPGIDVVNEIDVLSITGNVPTFISCKTGKMGAQQTLHALYELDTVAKRFGGKYAKKILVSAMDIANIYLDRASEMGIEVR